jgi:hypothetical protein
MMGFAFSGTEPPLSVTKVLMNYCFITSAFSTLILSTVYDNVLFTSLFTTFCTLCCIVLASSQKNIK